MPDIKNIAPKEKQMTTHELRTDAIDGIWQIAGLGCIMVGWYSDAGAIDMHGHGISVEVANLAETNAGLAKGADAVLQVGPFAALIAAIMPLTVQLLVNHKAIPAEKLPSNAGVVSPDVLESQVKTQMMKQAIAARKAQMDAEIELRQMQEEFNNFLNETHNGAAPE